MKVARFGLTENKLSRAKKSLEYVRFKTWQIIQRTTFWLLITKKDPLLAGT